MTSAATTRWYLPRHAVDYLLVFVPIAFVLEFAGAPPILIFAVSSLAIVPVAAVMGRCTEQLSHRAGPGIGGLLNATFGNAAELIIAIIGLSRGLGEVVKASITGSIIGNCLLVVGLAILAGGLKYPVQRFNRTAASMGSTLMALAAIGMLVPTIFWHSAKRTLPSGDTVDLVGKERGLSLEIAIVLGAVYVLSLVFSLWTHKHLYAGGEAPEGIATAGAGAEALRNGQEHQVSVLSSVGRLLAASVFVAILAEFLVGALEPTARALGLTDLFVGVIVVAIVGNAAEHSSAVFAAMRNHIDLSMHIAIGSSLQIALFVTPLLLGISYFVGPAPIDLHFSVFEVTAVGLGVGSVILVAQDGESNWLEGVMLLAVYAILGVAFYFLP